MVVARSVLRTIRSAAGADNRTVIYECRRCGLTLDGDGDRCPECGVDDVAQFCF